MTYIESFKARIDGVSSLFSSEEEKARFEEFKDNIEMQINSINEREISEGRKN